MGPVSVWVCESYVVHYLNATGPCCAPPTCIVHHRPALGTYVREKCTQAPHGHRICTSLSMYTLVMHNVQCSFVLTRWCTRCCQSSCQCVVYHSHGWADWDMGLKLGVGMCFDNISTGYIGQGHRSKFKVTRLGNVMVLIYSTLTLISWPITMLWCHDVMWRHSMTSCNTWRHSMMSWRHMTSQHDVIWRHITTSYDVTSRRHMMSHCDVMMLYDVLVKRLYSHTCTEMPCHISSGGNIINISVCYVCVHVCHGQCIIHIIWLNIREKGASVPGK